LSRGVVKITKGGRGPKKKSREVLKKKFQKAKESWLAERNREGKSQQEGQGGEDLKRKDMVGIKKGGRRQGADTITMGKTRVPS